MIIWREFVGTLKFLSIVFTIGILFIFLVVFYAIILFQLFGLPTSVAMIATIFGACATVLFVGNLDLIGFFKDTKRRIHK